MNCCFVSVVWFFGLRFTNNSTEKRLKAEKGQKNTCSFFSPSGELNKSGEADTDTVKPPPTDDNALDTSSTSSTSGGSRHFQEHWLKLFPWIVHEDCKMFCISCKRVGARNSFTSGCANFKTSAIKDNMKTSDHINALQVPGLQINKTRVEAALLPKKKAAGHAVRAMHWIIQEDLPIAKYPKLIELLREYEVQDITC